MSQGSEDVDAPPGALDGVRVLDLTENLAGPYCAQALADLGADVVKVERPTGGDPARAWGPPFWGGESTLFLAANRGKRSVVLDLKEGEGLTALRRLAGRADVLLQSFRPGVAERLGCAFEDLAGEAPRLIYCSFSAYGREGPLAALPGYDPLLQAHGGLMSVTGHPGQPARVGTSLVDMGTGLWAALGVLAALRLRERTGRGSHLEASLFDTALAWGAYHLMAVLAGTPAPEPMGAGFPSIVPYGAFPTADGFLMIAAANDALFRRLCLLLELPALPEDPRFADNPARVAHREELEGILSRATGVRTSVALTRLLRDGGVPCAAVLSMDQVLADPQTRASGMLQPTPAAWCPELVTLAPPLRGDGQRARPRRPPPRPGEHTVVVLREAGYTESEAVRLAGRWAVGTRPAGGSARRGHRTDGNGGSALDDTGRPPAGGGRPGGEDEEGRWRS